MRWILAMLLLLVAVVACEKEPREMSRVSDKDLGIAVDYWMETLDGWRKNGVAHDIRGEVERLRTQEEEWGRFNLADLRTSEEELASFIRQGMIPIYKSEWERLLRDQWNQLSSPGEESQPEAMVKDLLKKQSKYKLSIQDAGQKQEEIDLFIGMNHAKQAQYILRLLYRFPTKPKFLMEQRYLPKFYLARFEREIASAGTFAPDEPIYTDGPVTIEHAQELTKIAYMRIMSHLLDQLRAKTWTYPDSSDRVDVFLNLSRESGLPVAVLETSLSELETLRLRVPVITSPKKPPLKKAEETNELSGSVDPCFSPRSVECQRIMHPERFR